MAKKNSINLLRSSQTHYLDTFLKWAMTTGRFLIILTETIALSAFAYRFSLDREIIDLSDSIKDKQILVSYYKDAEVKFRNLHERLAFAQSLSSPTEPKLSVLQELVDQARGKLTFQSLSIESRAVSMSLTTNSTAALASFLSGVRALPEVNSATVDRVENKATSGLIVVSVTISLKNTKGGALSDAND